MHILAWNTEGKILLDRELPTKALSVSGVHDSDIRIDELGASSLIFRGGKGVCHLLFQTSDGSTKRSLLRPGKTIQIGPLSVLVTLSKAKTVTNSVDLALPKLIADTIAWASKPMQGATGLRDGLNQFLKLTIQNSPASSGMIVVIEKEADQTREQQVSLVSNIGITTIEAEKLWQKMPPALNEDIIKNDAKILLPEELKKQSNGDSTVFVRGIRSVAGFPVFAEGRMVAVVYLGFENILTSLSQEIQEMLESSATLLGIVIQRALFRTEVETLKHLQGYTPHPMPEGRLMVGVSERLAEAYNLISRFAPVDVPTLIQGETGTGKELAAREIHRMSPRARKPFVVVNAAALPEALIESELFGHKKGSFTGALSDRLGLVEQAQGGTLFIDEIGELSLPMQAKLLRALQERAIVRIGETSPRLVDFRLVTATHRDLEEKIGNESFREDLYYRIAGATIRMPPLRERREDIIPLANYFKKRFIQKHGLEDKEWSQNALDLLEANTWEGNIRELENVVARALVMSEGFNISSANLRIVKGAIADKTGVRETLSNAKQAWLKKFIIKSLNQHDGRRTETAKSLGIGERTLFRYIDQFDIRA